MLPYFHTRKSTLGAEENFKPNYLGKNQFDVKSESQLRSTVGIQFNESTIYVVIRPQRDKRSKISVGNIVSHTQVSSRFFFLLTSNRTDVDCLSGVTFHLSSIVN